MFQRNSNMYLFTILAAESMYASNKKNLSFQSTVVYGISTFLILEKR